MYDIQNDQMTFVTLGEVNGGSRCQSVNGTDFTNINRYASTRGLSQIMR